MADKKEIRARAKKYRSSLSEEDIILFSDRIFTHLIETEEYKQANILLSYVEYNKEVITTTIIKKFLTDGKPVAVPMVHDNCMDFYIISDISELQAGFMGIPEPLDNINNLYVPLREDNVLMLLPGLAYDRSLNRIGYGGGYYDRYLFRYRQNINTLAGLAFEGQIFDTLPTEDFDYMVDMVITDKKIYR